MMTSEEYNWTINVVRDRHHHFKLTFEQAEKVYQFEKEKDLYSEDHHFSVWEEYDYTLDNFQKILNKKQLAKFLKWHEDNIKRHEQFLLESDKEQIKFIDYYTELINYYEQKYIPDFYKEKFLISSLSLSTKHKAKIFFLKQEYRAFLESEKVGFISSHYRHNKLFKPNELKATLLRHKLSYIIPHFPYFKAKMDDPTKAVAQFLLNSFKHILEQYSDFFKKKNGEFSAFVKDIQAKYIGESKGWHIIITETEEQAKENEIMQVILMDIQKYSS